MVYFKIKEAEIISQMETEKIGAMSERRWWDALIEASPHEFHTFWWLKQVEMDYNTYFACTNSIFPISLLNVKKGWKVLDVGCGWGRDVHILRKAYGADAIGIDNDYRRGYHRNEDITADGRFLCFKDNSFDAVIAITTLGYVKEEELMLREILRILKHDGKLLLLLYNNSLSNLTHQTLKSSTIGVGTPSYYGNYRKLHNMKGILSLLESLDFKVEVAYYANFAVTLLNKMPNFYKIIFKYENKLSKTWIARWIAKRIIVIAKANK
jgi:cyclopropane fatty-acyl-phospholipid synthase-like methyltransferase